MLRISRIRLSKWSRVIVVLLFVFFLTLLFISFLPSGVEQTIKVQPVSVTAEVNQTAKFSIKAVGSALKYQWQYSTDEGKTWNNTSFPSNSPAVEMEATAARNGLLFHCIVKNGVGSVTSKAARLIVSGVKPRITGQPVSATAEKGKTVSFKVVASGTGLTYQWQFSSDGGKTWKNTSFPGDTATIKVEATKVRNGLLFHCIVKNSVGSVTSKAAKLIVQ